MVLEVALSPVLTSACGQRGDISAVQLFPIVVQAENVGECVGDDKPGGAARDKCWLIRVHHVLLEGTALVFSQKMQYQPGGETVAASTSPAPSMDTADAVFLPVIGSAILVTLPVPAAFTKPWVLLDLGPLCCTPVPCVCSALSIAKQEVNPTYNKSLC